MQSPCQYDGGHFRAGQMAPIMFSGCVRHLPPIQQIGGEK